MSDDTRRRIIEEAKARRGISYRLDPPPDGVRTLDCSLFVLQVLSSAGVPLPTGVRTAEQIRQATVPVPFADVLPGDLFDVPPGSPSDDMPDGRLSDSEALGQFDLRDSTSGKRPDFTHRVGGQTCLPLAFAAHMAFGLPPGIVSVAS